MLGLACSGKPISSDGTSDQRDTYIVGRYGPSELRAAQGTAFSKLIENKKAKWYLNLREPLFQAAVDSVYFIRTSGNVMELLIGTAYKPVMFFAIDTSGRQENYEYLGASVLTINATDTGDSTKLAVHIYQPGPMEFKPYYGTCIIASSHDLIGFTVECDEETE